MLLQVRWPGVEHRQLAFFVTGSLLAAGVLGLHSGVAAHPAAVPTAAPATVQVNAPAGPSAVVAHLEELRPVTASEPDRQYEREATTPRFPVNFQLRTGAEKAPEAPKPVTYTVREGDTLWNIARNFGTDEGTLAALNPDIDPDLIQPGTELKVLANFSGAVYVVQAGDTLDGVAREFSVSVEAIARANQIGNINELRPGQTLVLPGGRRTVRNTVVASRSSGASARTAAAGYIWPLTGVITSEFGPRWGTTHPGLDIAAPSGTPVVAARAGRVVLSAWDGNYGLSVVLDHGDGTRTRYAHASMLLVQVGQWVEQGAPVIRVGSTGFSTGPHLHFEVIINGTPVNPKNYLP